MEQKSPRNLQERRSKRPNAEEGKADLHGPTRDPRGSGATGALSSGSTLCRVGPAFTALSVPHLQVD